eukprot:jgi/Tetstr1/420274/TSEL_000142.t1
MLLPPAALVSKEELGSDGSTTAWRGVGKEPGVQVWRIEQLKVVPGGADSGFRHVELKQHAVLLRVNGERGREVVKYVAPGRAALYSGDVFVLGDGSRHAQGTRAWGGSLEDADSGSNDIQWIKPSAVKPTLDLATVPVWDQNISTRDNAQAVKISLSNAGYLDTTKGKGTHQEQLILLAVLRHATANYPMALAIVDIIIMDSRKCGHATWTALFTELQGSAIEERRRLEEEITAGQLPNEPVQVYVRRYRNRWNLLRKAHGQWTFEYVAINYLIP